MGTAERIAKAEKQKAQWNPKARDQQHKQLRKLSLASLRLVTKIGEAFPGPWTDDRAAIAQLVNGLLSLSVGSINASFKGSIPINPMISKNAASESLRKSESVLKGRASGVRWQLLRDLVYLASGMEKVYEERTIRRYLKRTEVPPWTLSPMTDFFEPIRL